MLDTVYEHVVTCIDHDTRRCEWSPNAQAAEATDTPIQSFYTFGEIDAEALSRANVSVDDIHYIPIDNSQGFWQFPNTTATIGTTSVSLGVCRCGFRAFID